MKQGVLMNGRIPIRLLLSTGHSCYRPRRDGERPKNPYFFFANSHTQYEKQQPIFARQSN